MIKIFDIQNGVVVPTEHCYTLYSLKRLMDLYPNHYLQIYQYCFYMTCYDPLINPFWNTKESEREEMIMEQLQPEFTTEDEGVQEALQLCIDLYETPTLRAFLDIKIGLEKLGNLMRNTTPIAGGKEANADTLLRIAKEFDKVRQSYKGTEKDLLEEQRRTRGGEDLAYDQDGTDDDDD